MAVVDFPVAFRAAQLSWGQQRRDLAFSSLFGSQSVELADPLWAVSLSPPNLARGDHGAWQALLLSLKGRANQLALWNLARPEPRGTLRGTLTLSGAHSAGDTTLAVTGGVGQAGATLKAGDYLGLGNGTSSQQLLMVMADATADGTGLISVSIHAALRNDFASGASVVWNKPCALFRQTASKQSWRYARGLIVDGIALDLIEDWRTS